MQADKQSSLLHDVAAYYSSTLSQHGPTPKGVDWNGEESQRIRFDQLRKLISDEKSFSINDLGCGYGALFEYLRETYRNFDYYGVDVLHSMIDAALARHEAAPHARFCQGTMAPQVCEYSVASGIFSVCLDAERDAWRQHVKDTISHLHASSIKGFAFNCLTSYSDPHKMKPHLFYADPCELFDFCKRNFSPHVALLHDYGLFEFTILVRKTA